MNLQTELDQSLARVLAQILPGVGSSLPQGPVSGFGHVGGRQLLSPERVDAPASSSGLSGGSSGLSGGGDAKPSAHQAEQPAASSNKVDIEKLSVEELKKHLLAKD